MIRITTPTFVVDVDEDEAQGVAEMLEIEGIEFRWEDLSPPTTPNSSEFLFFASDD